MPVFLVKFAAWLADLLFPQVIRQLLTALFKWLMVWFGKIWVPIATFLVFIFEWLLTQLWKLLLRPFGFLGTQIWNKWFYPIILWLKTWLLNPIVGFIIVIVTFFAKFIMNHFGYPFIATIIKFILGIIAKIISFVLDSIFTLIDFTPIVNLLSEWAGLPSCFVEIALAVGLDGALSALLTVAVACIVIRFVLMIIRR